MVGAGAPGVSALWAHSVRNALAILHLSALLWRVRLPVVLLVVVVVAGVDGFPLDLVSFRLVELRVLGWLVCSLLGSWFGCVVVGGWLFCCSVVWVGSVTGSVSGLVVLVIGWVVS